MKTFKYMLVGIVLFSCWQCSKEDDITADLVPYRRSYDINSPDTVMRFVSQYYYKYNHHFLVDPDSSDYLYNFERKNPVSMRRPEQSTEHLLYGISLMKELFLDFYPDNFIKNHFPFSLILADTIVVDNWQGEDFYASRNFVALNIGKKTEGYGPDDKKRLSTRMHLDFLVNIFYQYGAFELSDFFAPGEKLYSTRTGEYENPRKWTQDEIYAVGFLYDDTYSSYYTEFVSKKQDLEDWLSFLWGFKKYSWSKIPANRQELIDTYPVMKQKYDALTKAIKECIGVDYNELVYPKK